MFATELREAMIARIATNGVADGWWTAAMRAVPRDYFLPATLWEQHRDPDGIDDLFPFHRADDPDEWLRRTYADQPALTQVDDGRQPVGGGGGREATSSASQPSVVAQMLVALRLEPGMRVLEIGTGTGWNAALLAHRVGPANVTTVEIDQDLARRARHALDEVGCAAVTVVHGDGELGWPGGAPYDRVIATASVQEVPPSWVRHTRSGGRIIVPWTTTYYPSGLLELAVDQDGIAHGRIGMEADFMQLRAQRIPRFALRSFTAENGKGAASETEVHPSTVVNQKRDAETAIGLRVPRCASIYCPDTETSGALHLVDQWSGSWARVVVDPGPPPYAVTQEGQRRLWDEVEAAYHWWRAAREPSVHDWMFVVGPAGTTITLEPLRSARPLRASRPHPRPGHGPTCPPARGW